MRAMSSSGKKRLYLIGMESRLERWLHRAVRVSAEDMFVLKCYGPIIQDAYDSLMRSVLLAVYQDGVEEIVVVGSAAGERAMPGREGILIQMREKGVETDHLRTVDYLMKYAFTGWRGRNVGEWLAGNESVAHGIKQTVELIRQHPLLPPGISVEGWLADADSGEAMPLVEYADQD